MSTREANPEADDQDNHIAQIASCCKSGFTPRSGFPSAERHAISDVTCQPSRHKDAPATNQAGASPGTSDPKRRNPRLVNFLGPIAPGLLGALLMLGYGPAAAANGAPKLPAPSAPSSAVPAVVRPAAASPYASFDTFGIIGERNIFNPNRVGRTPRNTNPPPPAADILSLVGTMDYDKGLFAFFDGSQPGFRQALHVGGTITGFTVTAIDSNGVELTRNGQKFPFRIGQQLRRPAAGDWTVLSLDAVQQQSTETTATAAATRADNPGAPPAIPADASETLKRLMEKRQNQLKQ